MFYALSERTVYHRFFHVLKSMPHARLQELLKVDYERDMVLVACVGKAADDAMVAGARYHLDRRTNVAEAAFLVRDEWQGKGLGTALFRSLIEVARANGVRGFTAEVLADGHAMLRVFHNSGLVVQSKLESGVYSLTMPFDGDKKA
jgi:GNAT superfamily N-acetyltransferase